MKFIGSIASFGTAYPLAYGEKGFYAADGHQIERYIVDEENGVLTVLSFEKMYLAQNSNLILY